MELIFFNKFTQPAATGSAWRHTSRLYSQWPLFKTYQATPRTTPNGDDDTEIDGTNKYHKLSKAESLNSACLGLTYLHETAQKSTRL